MALLLLAAAPPLQAQGHKMYKCIIDGRTVYQQTACPANAVDARPAASAPAASAASGAGARVHAAAASASAASSPRP